MLHKDGQLIGQGTLKLIQALQSIPELEDFYLVGGTALALQIGHRNSIDIDLFTNREFSPEWLREAIGEEYSFSATLFKPNTILSTINNIKTDFIRHDYPLIRPPIEEDGIRFLGREDLAAMKLHAIIQSGKRLKDFIDIHFLLEHFSLGQMIEFFGQKYDYINPMVALKAVNYFEDIDEQLDPPKIVKQVTVKDIRKRIRDATIDQKKVFKRV